MTGGAGNGVHRHMSQMLGYICYNIQQILGTLYGLLK